MSLRPYQTDCIAAIRQSFRQGKRKQLCVLATGLGKAVVAANITSRQGRTLFLVHRDELAYQAAEKFHKYNPGLRVGIEKAEMRAEDADVVVGSIQTLSRQQNGDYNERLKSFDQSQFTVIHADESHHCTSAQWISVLRYMRVLKGEEDDPRKVLIGWTATPSRGDSIGLEKIFDSIVFNYGIREGIDGGYLTKIVAYRVETSVDLSNVKVVSGDFQLKQLTETVNTPERNELICQKYGELCPNRPALFFTTTIQHSIDLAEAMNGHGVRVYPLSGDTPGQERKHLIAAFKSGDIAGLASCGVLSEGTDLPNAEIGFMCRPTKSSLLFRQQVGRILRPYPSPEDMQSIRERGESPAYTKDHATIIDFVDVSAKHQLITAPTIFGLRANFNPKGTDLLDQAKEVEEAQEKYPTLDLRSLPDMDGIRAALRSVDLLAPPAVPEEIRKVSKFAWLSTGEGCYHLGLLDHSMLSVRQNTLGIWEAARHTRGIRSVIGEGGNLREALRIAEATMPKDDQQVLRSRASWREEGPTDKQASRAWQLDQRLRERFPTPSLYFQFCDQRFSAGDAGYSKGGMSCRISALEVQRS